MMGGAQKSKALVDLWYGMIGINVLVEAIDTMVLIKILITKQKLKLW
jgi:hypothetical protein